MGSSATCCNGSYDEQVLTVSIMGSMGEEVSTRITENFGDTKDLYATWLHAKLQTQVNVEFRRLNRRNLRTARAATGQVVRC